MLKKSEKTINLSNISISDGDAFCGCKNLTSVTIPENISIIGSDAFLKCSNSSAINADEKAAGTAVRAACFIQKIKA
ncbi:leucine-rich repeat protein [Caproicibacter sp.]|uniref:leucine-rich repeat protein n=1 Tax=Caproicibacter sp. TaxID=2814884 RepID=UPI0039896829